MFIRIIAFTLIAVSFISCQSLVYSPSINLPDKIQKDETTLMLAYERLPLTYYDEAKNLSNDGFMMSLQHSFSDKFALQSKYFASINSMKNDIRFKHGASISGYFLLSQPSSDYKYYIVPTFGMSLEENEIMLGTGGVWIAMQVPELYFIEPYFALGVLYGNTFYSQSYSQGFRQYNTNNDGIAIVPNIGTYIALTSRIKLNIEITLPFFSNFDYSDAYFVPTLGFRYKF
ncbi:MAG: hypothetical protein KIT33_07100 [Candidatus Kapabacteria bacterium]|nr:hypothetical protein [Ignavibacteriota bacterium]MCW5884721.1 hypothetical protein [Candidatus Kapabacteria bacterium]